MQSIQSELFMTESTHPANQVKKRGTSIFLLIGFGILGVAAYLAGPTVMKYALFFQEQRKHNRINSEIGKSKLPTSDAVSSPEAPPMVTASTPGGPGGGRPDPEEMFKGRDKDGNGKLEGTEISERMQTRLAEIDKDADGAVSKEEFLAAIPSRQAPSGSSSNAPADPPTAEIKLDAGTAPEPTSDEPSKETSKE